MRLGNIHGAGTEEWVTEKYDSLRFLKGGVLLTDFNEDTRTNESKT